MTSSEAFIVLRVINNASSELRRVGAELGQLKERNRELREGAEVAAIGGVAMMGAGAAIAAPLYEGVKAAAEWQGEQAHIRTAMNDGAAAQEHLNEVTKVADDLSSHFAITKKAEGDAYYIARSNSLNHTQALAAMTAATNLTIATTADATAAQAAMEPVTRLLTTSYINYGDKTKDVNEQIKGFSDTLAKLQTQYAFKDITEITYAMEYAIPMAKAAGVAYNDVASAIALLSERGLHGAEAGTAVQELIQKLAEGGKLLGYTVSNATGGIDLGATVAKLGTAFNGLNDRQKAMMLTSIGLSGVNLKAVALLLDSADEYSAKMKGLNNNDGYAAATAQIRGAALDEQWAKVGNQIHNVSETIGTLLLPSILKLTAGLSKVVAHIQAFTEHHATVAKYVAIFAAITAGLLLLGGALLLAAAAVMGFFALAEAFPIVIGWISSLTNLTKIWTGAQWLLNAAMAANPVGLMVAGIVAAAAAAGFAVYEIYEHWDGLLAYFKNLGIEIYDFLIHPWLEIGAGIKAAAGGIKSAAIGVAGAIARFFKGHSPIPEGPLRGLNLGREIASTIAPTPDLLSRARAVASALATTIHLPQAVGNRLDPGGRVGGTVTVNFSPRITIGGETKNAGSIKAQVTQALKEAQRELFDLMDRELVRRRRMAY